MNDQPTPETDAANNKKHSRRFRCLNCNDKCRASEADRGKRKYCRPCEYLIQKYEYQY